jgi:hypothetical protein
MSSYHARFNREWLFETPMATGASHNNPYHELLTALQYNIEGGNEPTSISDNLMKLEFGDQVTYWFNQNGTIGIITQFEKTPNGLFIELTGKRPGAHIYASEFYELILNDANRLIFSGDMLSDQGFGIWHRLFADGKKLFAYDSTNPLKFQTIDSEADLKKYISSQPDYKKYRYVLSESIKQHTYVQTSFDLLRTYNLTFGVT